MGDYLAVAVSGMGINYEDSDSKWISNHSGFTEREMEIPFIAVEKDNEMNHHYEQIMSK